MKKFLFSISAVFIFAVSLGNPAFAQETYSEAILSFDSEIEVQADSSLIVTETIKVIARGQQIKRGIYRDFPTKYRRPDGSNYRVGFDILYVYRDGVEEPFHTESRVNGVRLYIGDKNHLVGHGEHTYEITYKTTRQLGFFKEHDELYWNVTGNEWAFPIHQVSATVVLPDGARQRILDKRAFTGRQGSREQSYYYSVNAIGQPVFQTTRLLRANEGFTIFVAWPKGYVKQPSGFMLFVYFLKDNIGVIVAMLCLLIVLIYYLTVWVMVGKDPKKGTIIPLYYPPKGFSPASMRYLAKMNFDNKAFSAAIINMAVKGYLTIEEDKKELLDIIPLGKTYTLKKTRLNEHQLTKEERAVARALLRYNSKIELKQENHETIRSAIDALKSSLSTQVEKVYFLTNSLLFICGAVLSAVLGFVTAKFFLSDAATITNFIILLSLGALVVINLVFYHLMKAPTLHGRRVMDKIEGFKMFLSVTEKERMNLLNPPEKTPELFEKYLPFALALDVENKWAEQFDDVLAAASAAGEEYHPHWYHGDSWNRMRVRDFSSSLGDSFSSAISSSSTPPGSSSGGGGFSGGGGGGGGGGGW